MFSRLCDTAFNIILGEKFMSDFEISGDSLIRYNGNEDMIFVPREVKYILPYAFSGSKVRKVWIQKNVLGISHHAFYCCPNLDAIIFGEAYATAALLDHNFISDCPNLHAIEVPERCTYFTDSFPYGCKVFIIRN